MLAHASRGWDPNERSAGFIIEIGTKITNCKYYADKLQSWFENEGIKPPEEYKIVDLWNDKDFYDGTMDDILLNNYTKKESFIKS